MDEIKNQKFQYYGDSLKNPIFRGGSWKAMYRGKLPEKGGVGQFANLRGGVGKKEGVVFLRGG